ncbi:MAG: DUF2203 domain-containing protein [Chloroflexota bacterium]
MRHYTTDEANALLPTLTQVLQDLQALDQRMHEAVESIDAFEKLAKQNGHGRDAPALHIDHDVELIGRDMQERFLFLETQDIVLKDISNGILDFPSRLHDREVFLCWRLGEDRVTHWHDLDTGYAGRQLL